MVEDIGEIRKIDAQIKDFKTIAMDALKNKTPTQWWESYGEEHLELQAFSIQVLSLNYFTCSTSFYLSESLVEIMEKVFNVILK